MKTMVDQKSTTRRQQAYVSSGVDTELQGRALDALLVSIRDTFRERPRFGRPLLDIGFFANVLDVGNNVGIAVSTDGVGTKALIAQMMGKYDTIGIDCVAMNVNDVLCVGAEPLALLDYLAVQVPDVSVFQSLGEGLARGARQANISIPGGEVAQIKEMLTGHGQGTAFDLVGSCVGFVPSDKIIDGRALQEGDVIVGLASNGIHCNGLTLARKALFENGGLQAESYVPELGRTVGAELLEPTRIYVAPVLEMLRADLSVRALVHVTSDGTMNLSRVASDVSFIFEHLPEPQPIFELIRKFGDVDAAEMYEVFNMGLGFCVVVDKHDSSKVIEVASRHGVDAWELGYVVADAQRRVELRPAGLRSENGSLVHASVA